MRLLFRQRPFWYFAELRLRTRQFFSYIIQKFLRFDGSLTFRKIVGLRRTVYMCHATAQRRPRSGLVGRSPHLLQSATRCFESENINQGSFKRRRGPLKNAGDISAKHNHTKSVMWGGGLNIPYFRVAAIKKRGERFFRAQPH